MSRADFDRVQNGPCRKSGGACFLVLSLPRDAAAPARLGVIASRKAGNAVRRNRAKRLVRHFFRTHAAELGSFDVVVVVKSGAAMLSQSAATLELATALSRLGVRLPPKAIAP